MPALVACGDVKQWQMWRKRCHPTGRNGRNGRSFEASASDWLRARSPDVGHCLDHSEAMRSGDRPLQGLFPVKDVEYGTWRLRITMYHLANMVQDLARAVSAFTYELNYRPFINHF